MTLPPELDGAIVILVEQDWGHWAAGTLADFSRSLSDPHESQGEANPELMELFEPGIRKRVFRFPTR